MSYRVTSPGTLDPSAKECHTDFLFELQETFLAVCIRHRDRDCHDMLLTRSCSGSPSQCIGWQGRQQQRTRCVVASSAVTEVAASAFEWRGSDEFSSLDDRKDLPPVPLPPIKTRRRVVLVRHGQSTWNAEGRIQGSSNYSCLTPKGIAQAETTRDMVRTDTNCRM